MDLISVTIKNGQTVYFANIEYLGQGLFLASYLPLKAGIYTVSVKMGIHDIHCGQAESEPCSPFPLLVEPGPTVPQMSEAESPADESMDYLVESVAGEFGYFYIQAKDAYGNNQIKGGDQFDVMFTLSTDSMTQFRGNLDDHGDGTYTVHYTIPTAGVYSVSVTLTTSPGIVEPVLSCVNASSPYVFTRAYDGLLAYTHPSVCTLNQPQLEIVHNDFNSPTSTYDDGVSETLAYATVGITNSFTIQARDSFGNLRRGDSTTHFSGYGDGVSDYFLVEFTQPETNDYYRVSSAIDQIVASPVTPAIANAVNYFRLQFAGLTTMDIPSSISAYGLEAILESLLNFQLDVVVSKTSAPITGSSSSTVTWSIQFLTMLNVWQSEAATGPSLVGQRLTILPPVYGSNQFYSLLSRVRPANQGVYPVSFTLWHTGTYAVRITNNGVDIFGSPTSIFVSNAPVDPTASLSAGASGGTAGVPITVAIQAKDTRQTEIQYVLSSATVSAFTTAIQSVTLPAGTAQFQLSFRGQSVTINPGTSAYSVIASLTTLGTVTFTTATGTAITTSTKILPSASFLITFSSLVGPLPLLVASSATVLISHSQIGDAPFRSEVKVIKTCSLSAPSNLEFVIGTTTAAIYSMTAAEVQRAISTLGFGAVSISSPDCSGTVTLCSCTLFVKFDNFKGPVPPMTTSKSTVVVSQSQSDGALSGIFPLYGSFSLGIHGENTTSLSFDATATDVQNALVALYSVGDITVTKDTYGVPLDANGVTLYPSSPSIFSIWTIFFSSTCDSNVNGVASGNCPASLGEEPLLFVNTDRIQYLSSPYTNQANPQISSIETVKGYGGNNRLNHDDLSLVSLSLTQRLANPAAQIGMSSVQKLLCQGTPAISTTFVLTFLNQSVTVSSSMSAQALNSLLGSKLDSLFSIKAVSASSPAAAAICSATGETTLLTVAMPYGSGFPLIQVVHVTGSITAAVYPVTTSVDSTSIVTGSLGLYEIVYTPTIAGIYDIRVMINGVDVSTDWTPGVSVSPALEYSATSTHNISQVNVEGVREYFTVQFRDKYGNALQGPLADSSRVMMSMVGSVDDCTSDGDSLQNTTAFEIPLQILDNAPYTDGVYTTFYDPTIAGSYEISVKLLTRGGLLATYYKTENLSQPVLASSGNFHDPANLAGYHDPYWCAGLNLGNFSTGIFCDLFPLNVDFLLSSVAFPSLANFSVHVLRLDDINMRLRQHSPRFQSLLQLDRCWPSPV